MGIGTRLGHSYCRPSRPWCEKLEACVQVFRFGEVKIPITNSWAYATAMTQDEVGAYHITFGSRNWVLLMERTGLPEYLVKV